MKVTLFFLFITFLFIISGCTVPPAVSISTLNRTGYILDEGRKEIGINTFLYMPTNIYFSYGLKNNIEFQGRLGTTTGFLSKFDIYHGELILLKEFYRKNNFLFNSSLGLDLWFNPENNFLGYNLSSGITLGWIPISYIGLYFPVTINLIGHNYNDGNLYTIFIPGIVVVLETEKMTLKAGANLPSYLDLNFFLNNLSNVITNKNIENLNIGNIEIQPNIGLELSYKW